MASLGEHAHTLEYLGLDFFIDIPLQEYLVVLATHPGFRRVKYLWLGAHGDGSALDRWVWVPKQPRSSEALALLKQ